MCDVLPYFLRVVERPGSWDAGRIWRSNKKKKSRLSKSPVDYRIEKVCMMLQMTIKPAGIVAQSGDMLLGHVEQLINIDHLHRSQLEL